MVEDPNVAHDVVVGNKAASWLRSAVKGSKPFLGVELPRATLTGVVPAGGIAANLAPSVCPSPPSFNERDLSDKPRYILQKTTV